MATSYPEDETASIVDPRAPAMVDPSASADGASAPGVEVWWGDLTSPSSLRAFTEFEARELKTCASIIRGWTELISRGLLKGDEVAPAYERIRQACARVVLVATHVEALGERLGPDDAAALPDGSTPHR